MFKRIKTVHPFLLLGFVALFSNSCNLEEDEVKNLKDNETNQQFHPYRTYGTMTDNDGNCYKTIIIGSQTWMAENLKTTKYNDGTNIPNIIVDSLWKKTKKGAQCTINKTTNKDSINKYGRLYNWYAVDSGKLCPKGWHVPADSEWTILTNYLIENGYNYNGSLTENAIAKSLASSSDWEYNIRKGSIGYDQATNNGTGFSALPSGTRTIFGNFYSFKTSCYMWSSTEIDSSSTIVYKLCYCNISFNPINYYLKNMGSSVRCVKN